MTNEQATPLGAVLKALMKQAGLDKKMQEFSALDHWEDVVGAHAAKATTLKKMENGRLIVSFLSPVWRAEISLRREEITRKLNEKAGGEVIKEIVIK